LSKCARKIVDESGQNFPVGGLNDAVVYRSVEEIRTSSMVPVRKLALVRVDPSLRAPVETHVWRLEGAAA
jgi:hypothetical protein